MMPFFAPATSTAALAAYLPLAGATLSNSLDLVFSASSTNLIGTLSGGSDWYQGAYVFTYSGSPSPLPTNGATYSNNGHTFTVLYVVAPYIVATGTGVPTASGTLTKATGTGAASVTFTAYVTGLARYYPTNAGSVLSNSVNAVRGQEYQLTYTTIASTGAFRAYVGNSASPFEANSLGNLTALALQNQPFTITPADLATNTYHNFVITSITLTLVPSLNNAGDYTSYAGNLTLGYGSVNAKNGYFWNGLTVADPGLSLASNNVVTGYIGSDDEGGISLSDATGYGEAGIQLNRNAGGNQNLGGVSAYSNGYTNTLCDNSGSMYVEGSINFIQGGTGVFGIFANDSVGGGAMTDSFGDTIALNNNSIYLGTGGPVSTNYNTLDDGYGDMTVTGSLTASSLNYGYGGILAPTGALISDDYGSGINIGTMGGNVYFNFGQNSNLTNNVSNSAAAGGFAITNDISETGSLFVGGSASSYAGYTGFYTSSSNGFVFLDVYGNHVMSYDQSSFGVTITNNLSVGNQLLFADGSVQTVEDSHGNGVQITDGDGNTYGFQSGHIYINGVLKV